MAAASARIRLSDSRADAASATALLEMASRDDVSAGSSAGRVASTSRWGGELSTSPSSCIATVWAVRCNSSGSHTVADDPGAPGVTEPAGSSSHTARADASATTAERASIAAACTTYRRERSETAAAVAATATSMAAPSVDDKGGSAVVLAPSLADAAGDNSILATPVAATVAAVEAGAPTPPSVPAADADRVACPFATTALVAATYATANGDSGGKMVAWDGGGAGAAAAAAPAPSTLTGSGGASPAATARSVPMRATRRRRDAPPAARNACRTAACVNRRDES